MGQRALSLAPKWSTDLANASATDQARKRHCLFMRLLTLQILVPHIVLLDNATIHKGEKMAKKRRRTAHQGLPLYDLSSCSPEVDRIEIAWQYAK